MATPEQIFGEELSNTFINQFDNKKIAISA
jgi:hypothetical protein